jgi:hypothetical protein
MRGQSPSHRDRSSKGQDAFIRDVALLLGIPLVAIFAIGMTLLALWSPWRIETYQAPSGTSVTELVAGVWDGDDAPDRCVANPHRIGFSPDTLLMVVTHKEPWTDSTGVRRQIAEYDILQVSADRIRGQIRGETQMTSAGEPVVWEVVLVSPNSYRWRRTDLGVFGFTGSVSRCPEADSTVFR